MGETQIEFENLSEHSDEKSLKYITLMIRDFVLKWVFEREKRATRDDLNYPL